MKVSIRTFRGEVRRADPERLPDGFAQRAENARLLSGDLEAWPSFAKGQLLGMRLTTPPYPVKARDSLKVVDFYSANVTTLPIPTAEIEVSFSPSSVSVRALTKHYEDKTRGDIGVLGLSAESVTLRIVVKRYTHDDPEEVAVTDFSALSVTVVPKAVRYTHNPSEDLTVLGFAPSSITVENVNG